MKFIYYDINILQPLSYANTLIIKNNYKHIYDKNHILLCKVSLNLAHHLLRYSINNAKNISYG